MQSVEKKDWCLKDNEHGQYSTGDIGSNLRDELWSKLIKHVNSFVRFEASERITAESKELAEELESSWETASLRKLKRT